MTREKVRDFLRHRGSAAHVVEGGVAGLLKGWERAVASVDRGYRLTLDDYLNDLDGRQILAEIVSALPGAMTTSQAERLATADARLRAATRPGPCLWGEANARAQGWTPRSSWWYFRHPRRPGAELAADIASRVGAKPSRENRNQRRD
jgi:hypothetical protein